MDISYVRGFFDRLCSVDVANRAIVLTTDRVDLGRRVAARLRQERIRCGISMIDHGERLKLRIGTRTALQRWHELVGFEDETKNEKLQAVLASYGGGNAGNPAS